MSKAEVFIDHLTLPVRDLEASRSFYRRALAPFGVEEVEAWGGIGWGPPGRVDFFIRQGESTAPLHLAFAAPDRATVDAFHAAALAAGNEQRRARAPAALPRDLLQQLRDRPRRPQRRSGLSRAGAPLTALWRQCAGAVG